MNQRAQYLIQILDKIGAPLLSAAEQSGNDEETATIVASLLGKVVETSISMNQTLDLTASDAQDDSLRVALAALAGSLVANQYKQKGKLPEAGDLSRVQSAMSAVLTFADNFTLSPEHTERLEKLKADGGVVDAHQINIQYVDALIPVINAVGAFPFGQPEQKLIMDVSDRLIKRTAEMRETLLPSLSGDDEKLAELAILRAAANIYAASHEAETQRLTGSDGEAPARLSIEPVWKAFETRIAMLETVAKNLMPQSGTVSPNKPAANPPPATPVAPAAESEQTAAPPPPTQTSDDQNTNSGEASAPPAIFQSKPAEAAPPPVAETPAPPPTTPPSPPAQPSEQPAQTEKASGGGANPMGFFAKPKAEEQAPADDGSVSPPMAQPENPPPAAPETPPPAAAETPPPPPAAPPAPPPPAQAEEDSEKEDDSKGGDDSAGNPMSFFGKKN